MDFCRSPSYLRTSSLSLPRKDCHSSHRKGVRNNFGAAKKRSPLDGGVSAPPDFALDQEGDLGRGNRKSLVCTLTQVVSVSFPPLAGIECKGNETGRGKPL